MARFVLNSQKPIKKTLTKGRRIDKVKRNLYLSLILNIVLFALLVSK